MKNKKDKLTLRIICVAVAFIAICLVYFVRMINLAANAEPGKIQTGTYTRQEIIQAVRGEIYDRNGKKLVYNTYTYDFIFDYNAMAPTQLERNYDILKAIDIIEKNSSRGEIPETSFPFDGKYPNYTYSSEAKSTSSNIYYRLLKRIAQNELEPNADIPKNELTQSYLEVFYSNKPEEFPTEDEIVEWYMGKYKLGATDEGGTPLFTNDEIDKIIRMRYDMEVMDFSVYNPYVVMKNVDMKLMTSIKENSIVGASFSVVTARNYAYPGYLSHILGMTGKITSENWSYYQSLGYDMNATIGISGCEQAFESYLRGIDGIMTVVEDKDGNIIEKYVSKPAVAGKDIYLTIDIDLQIAAEDGLKENIANFTTASSGAITAMNPNNGEVLVLASYPTYNLATYNQDYNSLIADEAKPLYNRALTGLYAPGSTFKVGMVAAGITNKTVTAKTKIECNQVYTYYAPSYTPTCLGRHGQTDAAYALQESCNCYFYELGRLMGIKTMNEYFTQFGLGQATGIELEEKTGILAGPDYRDQNGLEPWKPGNTIQAAIGQSDNSFTPMQLASYISTVLNGGTRYSATILLAVKEYGSGNVVYSSQREIINTVELSADAVKTVKEGMRRMVSSSATVSEYMKNIPVTVGGKTGTAQLGGNKVDNGLFVCAAPYNNPEIVISSIIESAGNSTRSSLASARILEAYYKK